jgi:hypothetical protein
MGLWTGIEKRFTSAACSLFHVDLKNPLKTIRKTLKSISKPPLLPQVGKVTDLLNVGEIPGPAKIPVPKIVDAPKILPNPLSNRKSGQKSKKPAEMARIPIGVPKNPISLFG